VGRITIRELSAGFQEASLAVLGEPTPITFTARLPFEMILWMGDGLDGSFEYMSSLSPIEHQRTLRVQDDTGLSVALIDRRNENPIRMTHGGIIVEQGGDGRSGPTPTHAYWYPVPVVIRAGGTVTSLWQRQAVVVRTQSGVDRVAVVVLASEVAKPHGRSVHLMEGPRHNLDLLVLRIDH
jgi:hypothetical protein